MYFSINARSSRALKRGRGRCTSSRRLRSKFLSGFVCQDISRTVDLVDSDSTTY